jgi:ketosteroid isomerase-like protein
MNWPWSLRNSWSGYHRAVDAFIKGDPSPQERIWSRRDDVTLANPLGPPALGWTEVSNALRRAVSQLSDGEVLAVERISGSSSGDLAYIVEIEHDRVRLGGAREPTSMALRVTTIFRREEDGWTVLHRHADSITTPRPVESMVQE